MAPFRGRGRGRGRGGAVSSSRPARSGIRTRGGQYKKFDSQRVREVSDDEEELPEPEPSTSESEGDDDSETEPVVVDAYTSLVTSLKTSQSDGDERPSKRRRLSVTDVSSPAEEVVTDSDDQEVESERDDAVSDMVEDLDVGLDDELPSSDPYEQHFAKNDDTLAAAVELAKTNAKGTLRSHPGMKVHAVLHGEVKRQAAEPLRLDYIKQRIRETAQKVLPNDDIQQTLAPYLFNYVDVVYAARAVNNALRLRQLTTLHAVNHVLKGSSKIVKHNARLAQSGDDEMLEFRDQGFTRPKVLIMCETRQMAVKYADHIAEIFGPQQQENRRTFLDRFSAPIQERDVPEDFNELFEGNNDNDFRTGIKLTRKALKFNTKFYSSDIILASPVGLRKIVDSEDNRKRDQDFLSSIEIIIIDQADAIQMQSAENLDFVFKHLNLIPSQLRDADMNRVRQFYLDGQAKHFRQTIVLSAYLTPEVNMLYSRLQNVSGKVRIDATHPGLLQAVSSHGIKQSFSRFDAKSPVDVPDARFDFFTTSVLPALTRLPQPSQGGKGILIFIPQYYDFVRVRRYFGESTLSFGSISEYTEVSGSNGQRSIRAKFSDGRMSFLLYSGRAHHFFRLRIRGVKRVIMYELPDNGIFYDEIAGGFMSGSIEQELVSAKECAVKSLFTRLDSMKLERVVGTVRAKGMLMDAGDTFEFV